MPETRPQVEPQAAKAAGAGLVPAARAWLAAHKPAVGIAVLLAVSAVATVAWLSTRDKNAAYRAQFQKALRLLEQADDPAARERSRLIAKQLRAVGYRDPEFPGGIEFILGMAAFHEAAELDGTGQTRSYLIAAHELRRSEHLVLDDSWRPRWAYALGTSLYEIGKPAEARPLLKEALQTYPDGRLEATKRLIDIYLEQRDPQWLQEALELNTGLMQEEGLSRQQLEAAHLRRARIHLALGHKDEATQALAELSQSAQQTERAALLRARILISDADAELARFENLLAEGNRVAEEARRAEQRQQAPEADRLNRRAEQLAEQAVGHKRTGETLYRQAMRILEPIAGGPGLAGDFAHQAAYLLGLCIRAVGDVDGALKQFERIADEHADSPEALASNLMAGDLLRTLGRKEEALDKRYRRVLQAIPNPDEFRNRWLSLQQVRDRILAAWNDWVERHDYKEAVALSRMMTPLFDRVEAYELTARAYEHWSEHIASRLARTPWSRRAGLQAELRKHRRQAGEAYGRLAEELKTTADYGEALRKSAEHLTAGHDFEGALRQWTRYIRTRPEGRLPEAVLRRGQVLIDLDRLDEALEQFRRVVEDYPTSPAAFDAQFIIGECHLERKEPDEAERVWRGILASDSLTPEAKQWQLALVSLGRLLHRTAEATWSHAQNPAADLTDQQRNELKQRAFARWDESILRLKEFLERRSSHPEAAGARHEARYLLAKSYKYASRQPRSKIENAETINARLELRRKVRTLLLQALDQLERLQADLLVLEEGDMLGPVDQRLLRSCFFEIAHTHYGLAAHAGNSAEEDYERAIVAYNGAANKYPRNPQVLLAYLQMTNCYERLNKPADARSMLEQARVVLKQMPKDRFRPGSTNLTKQQWQDWVQWAQQVRRYSDEELTAGP